MSRCLEVALYHSGWAVHDRPMAISNPFVEFMRRKAELMGLHSSRCDSPCSILGRDPGLCHATALPTLAGMAWRAPNLPEDVRRYCLVHFLATSTNPG